MQRLALISVLFALWSLWSWRWYVCGIKQQCGPQAAAAITEPAYVPDTAGAITPAAYNSDPRQLLQEGSRSEHVPVTVGTRTAVSDDDLGVTQLIATNEAVLIHFPYNSARREDDDAADAYLQALAAHLRQTGDRVTLTGHTDAIGDKASNKRMALQRARHIERLLRSKDVPPVQILVLSKGETEPLATNDKPRGRYLNRRVAIVVN